MKFLFKKYKKYIHHVRWKNVAIFGVLFFAMLWFLQKNVDIDVIAQHIENNPFRAPFLLIFLKAGTVVIAPLSGTAIYASAGVLFPFWEAFVYIAVGNILGMTGAFFLGRKYGDAVITLIFGKQGDKKLHKLIDRVGNAKGLFIARFVLFPIEDLVNYVAGMTKISYWVFLGISAFVTSLWVLPWLLGVDVLLSLLGL